VLKVSYRFPNHLIVFALAALTACSSDSMGKSLPAVSPTSAAESSSAAAIAKVSADTAAVRPSHDSAAVRPAAPLEVRVTPIRDTLRLPLLASRTAHDSVSYAAAIRRGARNPGWPVQMPAPLPGSLLPAKRIVAFYGNPLSKKMGALGEFPVDEMLSRLDGEVKRWQDADPATPVVPALHLIAVVAQGAPGRDGMYRLRMPDTLIERVYEWAQRKNGLLFLDIQVARSTVQAELPRLLPFLARSNVHLGLDPEFSMHYDKEGLKPGAKIGTMMAADVNYAVRTLAQLVTDNQLPPKILVVHRFTRRMVPNPSEIQRDPRVQVVIDMDGWGPPWLKFDSYSAYAVAEPVQFTGFKLFFHNDTKKGDALITPAELLRLVPRPMYIQYQ
jgi:hypothetical protein